MKKGIILSVALLACVSCCSAQQYGGYSYGDTYVPSYSPLRGPNGFRTVDEENRLMEEVLAERRRQNDYDNKSEDEIARAEKRKEQQRADHRKMFDADKKQAPKTKK